MPLREEKRLRVMRALFINLDVWFSEAMRIAESDNPRPLALNHARNLLQARGALSRLLPEDDVPPLPDDAAPPCCPADCHHCDTGACPPRPDTQSVNPNRL